MYMMVGIDSMMTTECGNYSERCNRFLIWTLQGMIDKLSSDDRGGDVSFISAVANSLFSETTNWGRVASLAAFGAAVCLYLKEKGREHCVELVGEDISTYLLTNQKDWLVKNNSWVS